MMAMRFFTFKRFIFYGFPVYLTALEYAMRYVMGFAPGRPEDVSIVAASDGIAAAGLSLIAPVLLPKPVVTTLDPATLAKIAAENGRLVNRRDQRLIVAGWLGLLFLPFPWGWLLWMAHNSDTRWDVYVGTQVVPGPFLIALCMYLVGMIYTELKEIA
jgi:hypothetical protein